MSKVSEEIGGNRMANPITATTEQVKQLEPGDILIFKDPYGQNLYKAATIKRWFLKTTQFMLPDHLGGEYDSVHAVIYIGNGQIAECSGSMHGGNVRILTDNDKFLAFRPRDRETAKESVSQAGFLARSGLISYERVNCLKTLLTSSEDIHCPTPLREDVMQGMICTQFVITVYRFAEQKVREHNPSSKDSTSMPINELSSPKRLESFLKNSHDFNLIDSASTAEVLKVEVSEGKQQNLAFEREKLREIYLTSKKSSNANAALLKKLHASGKGKSEEYKILSEKLGITEQNAAQAYLLLKRIHDEKIALDEQKVKVEIQELEQRFSSAMQPGDFEQKCIEAHNFFLSALFKLTIQSSRALQETMHAGFTYLQEKFAPLKQSQPQEQGQDFSDAPSTAKMRP